MEYLIAGVLALGVLGFIYYQIKKSKAKKHGGGAASGGRDSDAGRRRH